MTQIDVAFHGFLAADADARVSAKSGKPWTRLRVGVGQGDAIQWVSVACFGAAAEAAAGLKKGDKVYVEGDIKLDTWKGQDGVERHGLSVTTFRLIKTHNIGREKKREHADAQATRSGPRPSADRSASGLPDDSIPF
jgi:single-stranded DNA-binding protein